MAPEEEIDPSNYVQRFLKAQTRRTKWPTDDLIAKMRSDPGLPAYFSSLAHVRDCLRNRRYGDGIDAITVRNVWERYALWCRRNV